MIRTGIGYDVHQLVEGRPLILGGVEIEFDRGLSGHSDADVLAHAIADALLGALGEPDIGHWFPPTEASIEGIDSMDILRKVRAISDEHGATIHNVDATLVAEEPKINPHISAMKERVAEALSIVPAQVGIKATTNETMGFPGRQEGMCAMAVACVDAPFSTDQGARDKGSASSSR
jgi:2-C-methyl-D-erythritol 2,4-cyclodiphosphate synthase